MAPWGTTALLLLAMLARPAMAQAPRVDQTVTAGGLRLWSFADDGGDRFVLVAFVGAGSRHEPAGSSGIAHFLEHLLCSSTATPERQQQERELQRHGVGINGTTTREYTTYEVVSSAAEWRRCVAWLAEHLLQPEFTADDIEKERRIVFEEIDERQPHLGDVTIDGLLYPGSPLGRSTGGDRQELARIAVDDLRAFHARHYVGANMAIGFAGRVDRGEVTAALQAAFADLPAGGSPPANSPPMPRTGDIRLGVDYSTRSSRLLWGYHLPPTDGAGLAAQLLIASHLDGLLFDTVRERLQVAYSPTVRLEHFADTHRLEFSVRVSEQQNLAKVRQAIQAAVASLQHLDPEPFALARGRSMTALRADSVDELRQAMALCWLLRLGAETPDALTQAFDRLTPEDVAQYARAHLTEDHRYQITDGPTGSSGIEPATAAAMLLLLLLLLESFAGFATLRALGRRWQAWRFRPRPAAVEPPQPRARPKADVEELERSIQRYLEEEERKRRP